MKPIQTGIERLAAEPPRALKGKRLGLLANPASVDRHFRHSRFLIESSFPGKLKALFSPQHGFFAEKQDNMALSEDSIDRALNIPVFSLYGKTTTPTKSMLEGIDVLIVDLQDVGTRVYTYVYTMALCMQAARFYGKEIIILDRPNPLGGIVVEGNCLRPDYTSFVGMYPIPMRHGLTIGELALLFNNHFGIGCKLTIVPMTGWERNMLFEDTGLAWIAPSPNLPTPTSVTVYPGQVLFEGTNVSEGRGTTQPFEVFGTPFLRTEQIQKSLNKHGLAGVLLRPIVFEPTSNKWQNQTCYGFQLHVIAPDIYRPYLTTLTILKSIVSLYPDDFMWKDPPYEFEFEKLPFDLITGDPAIREVLEASGSLEALKKSWGEDLKEFDKLRRDSFLYE